MPSNVLPLRPNGHPHLTYDKEKLYGFIDEKSKLTNEWQCSVFHLYHKNEASPGAIDSAFLDKSLKAVDREQAIHAIVSEFEDNLKSVSAGYSTMQGFVVTAHASKELDAPSLFQHHISFKSEHSSAIESGEIEPATGTGALAQMQRVVDSLIADNGRRTDMLFDMMLKQNQRLMESNNERDAHILNYRLATEDLMDRKEERKLKLMQAEREGEFTKQITGMVLPILGGVVSKMLVNKGLVDPRSGAINQDNLRVMVEELNPKQMADFVMSLSDDQRTKFEPMLGPMLLAMPEKLKAVQEAAAEAMTKAALEQENKAAMMESK